MVDDEPDLCEILQFDLESEGYAVSTATSAEQALLLYNQACGAGETAYDLLLLDVMMGGMSGFEMAAKLRAEGHNTPIIFLTASDNYPKGFASGADDFIQKPFAFDNVLLRVKAVLRRAASPSPTPMSGLNLDTTLFEASIDGISLDLTRREFDILYLLHSHAGQFFSRAQILEAVWPNDTFVSDRSVDVHIARLRKKLGAMGSSIVNKIGIGYGMV